MQRCILSKFHIKPQLVASVKIVSGVVSYRNSTSNHNYRPRRFTQRWLYLIEIPHQTTTKGQGANPGNTLYLIEIPHQTTTDRYINPPVECCILSKFYIKPQRKRCRWYGISVVSYRNSTSNHNVYPGGWDPQTLYLIEILHQTTTCHKAGEAPAWLYLIEILHQTTTRRFAGASKQSCILSKFYIKPQRRASYWLIKCYLRAVCHYKNAIGCSDEASLMHFPYFKERK